MPSEFDEMFAASLKQLVVPPCPIFAIKRAAQRQSKSSIRLRNNFAWMALVLAIAFATAAVASQILLDTRVSVSRTGFVSLSADSETVVFFNPTPATVASAKHRLNFHPTFPGELPLGSTFTMMARAGTGALVLQYDLPGRRRSADRLLYIILTAPKASSGEALTRFATTIRLRKPLAARWALGNENVLVMRSTLTPAEMARLRSGMSRSSLSKREKQLK